MIRFHVQKSRAARCFKTDRVGALRRVQQESSRLFSLVDEQFQRVSVQQEAEFHFRALCTRRELPHGVQSFRRVSGTPFNPDHAAIRNVLHGCSVFRAVAIALIFRIRRHMDAETRKTAVFSGTDYKRHIQYPPPDSIQSRFA